MSKQAYKRVRRSLSLPVNRESLPSLAWPGGYPLYYVFADGGACCADCANDNITDIDAAMRGEKRWNSHGGWALGAFDTNWEDAKLHCDHCGKTIPCAYPAD